MGGDPLGSHLAAQKSGPLDPTHSQAPSLHIPTTHLLWDCMCLLESFLVSHPQAPIFLDVGEAAGQLELPLGEVGQNFRPKVRSLVLNPSAH